MAWNKGYSKSHPGRYGLLIDWETSGSTWGGDSSVEYQGLSFGAVVFETDTFVEVDHLYQELQFDENRYKWSDEASKIHGLTREHLAEHGVPRDQALAALIELMLKYFKPGSKILFAGHNVSFDNDFTTQLFRDFDLLHLLNIHHVTIDTSGIGFVLLNEYKSDVVFELLGGIEKRADHNALEDARTTLAVLRNAKNIFAAGLTVSN